MTALNLASRTRPFAVMNGGIVLGCAGERSDGYSAGSGPGPAGPPRPYDEFHLRHFGARVDRDSAAANPYDPARQRGHYLRIR